MRIPRILAYFRRFVFAVFVTALTFLSPAFACEENQIECNNQCYDAFTITLDDSATSFSFNLTAAGTFCVDWGGTVGIEDKSRSSAASSLGQATLVSPPSSGFGRIIKIGGKASLYSTSTRVPAIQFGGNVSSAGNITGISGSLGKVFPTLGSNSTQKPSFYQAFYGCSNLTGTIPDNLFSDITEGSQYKFYQMFTNCEKLYGPVPENLFAGIKGSVGTYTFREMFKGCTNLGKNAVGGTSEYYVPSGLFAGITLSTSTINSTFTDTGLLPDCPAGSYIYTGHSSYISTWGNKASCTPCAAGTYNNLTGQTSCTSCSSIGDGSYTESEAGATADSQCYKTATKPCSCGVSNIAHATSCSGTTDCIQYYNSDTCSTINSNICNVVSVTCESGYKPTTAGTACEPITYSISFNGNGNTGGSTSGMSNLSYGSPYTLTSNGFTRTGYDFDGWCVGATTCAAADKLADEASVSNLTTTDGATVTLYARWVFNCPADATVNGANDGCECNDSVNYTWDSLTNTCIANVACPTNATYSSTTEQCEPNTGYKWTDSTHTACTPIEYSVVFNGNAADASGSTAGMSNLAYGSSYNLTANGFTRTGYDFDGWCLGTTTCAVADYADNASVSDLTAIDGTTITMYAKWEPKTYTVTYTCDGVTTQTEQATYGTSYTSLDSATVCAAQGYTPSSFECVPNISSGTWNLDSNVTCSATRTGNTIALTWANGGHGTAPSTPATCTYGSTITMPAALTETGWTFNNWGVNGKTFNGGQQNVVCNYDNLGVSENNATATITASWTANTINLTWANGGHGGTAPSTPDKCTYGSTITMPAALTETGWTFNNWGVNGKTFNGGQQNVVCNYDNLGVSANNVTATITADWTLNTKTCSAGKYYDSATDACVNCAANNYCPGKPCDWVSGSTDLSINDNGLCSCFAKTSGNYPYSDASASDVSQCYYTDTVACSTYNPCDVSHGSCVYVNSEAPCKIHNDGNNVCVLNSENACEKTGFVCDQSYELDSATNTCKFTCPAGTQINETNDGCICAEGYTAVDGVSLPAYSTPRGYVEYSSKQGASCADASGSTSTTGTYGWLCNYNQREQTGLDNQNKPIYSYHGNALTPGKFRIWFQNSGVLEGTAKCSVTNISNGMPGVGSPVSQEGQNCWCRIDSYTPNGGSTVSVYTSWVRAWYEQSLSDCREYCAAECASRIASFGDYVNYTAMRNAVYGAVHNPCLYDCPSGTVLNSTGDGCVSETCVLNNPSSDTTSVCEGCTAGFTLNPGTKACDLDEYMITYSLDGGTLSGEYPTKYNVLSGTVGLPTPIKTGYTFVGWCTEDSELNPNCTVLTNNTFVPDLNDLGDKTFYAKWEANVYTFNLDENNAGTITTHVDPGTVYSKYDVGMYSDSNAPQQITGLTTTPVQTGYTFEGFWTTQIKTDSNSTQVIDDAGAFLSAAKSQIPVTGTTATWFAQWFNCGVNLDADMLLNTYHITGLVASNPNGLNCSYSVTCGAGYHTAVGGDGVLNGTYTVGSEHTLVTIADLANFCVANTINLEWDYVNGQSTTANTCAFGTEASQDPTDPYIHVPNVPTKTGYTFDGWEIACSGDHISGYNATTGACSCELGFVLNEATGKCEDE